MIRPTSSASKWEQIPALNTQLAKAIFSCATKHPFVVSIGGDHSCAVGTWSGIAEALQKDIGLIWIDAHMDSHTPETSESGNIHGMPLAALLGHGSPSLTHILSEKPKIKPENLFLVGIRSFEEGEKKLLDTLGVRVYFMDEVIQRGLSAVLSEILEKLSHIPYGISLDVDFFDPSAIIATGTPVPGGAHPEEFLDSYSLFEAHPPIAFELVEFNPSKDTDNTTLNHVLNILKRVTNRSTDRDGLES
jgi:arginase